jgi:hypothetical protein
VTALPAPPVVARQALEARSGAGPPVTLPTEYCRQHQRS